MPIDVHAHYVPPQLIDAVAGRGKEIGVRLVRSGATPPALHFDYGFKVRPFFPRLIEPVAERRAWLDEQGIDQQIVGTWPDLFGYGLPVDAGSPPFRSFKPRPRRLSSSAPPGSEPAA